MASAPLTSQSSRFGRFAAFGAGAVIVLVLVLLPHLVNFFYVHQAQTLALYVLVAAGLAVAVNYSGLISVGHAAIMAAGAYGSAYVATTYEWPFVVALGVGILAAIAVGFVIAIPSGRLEHFYFAMVTLGVGLVGEQLLVQWEWTGGHTGISGIPQASLFGYDLGRLPFYYATLLMTAVVVVLLRNVIRSRWGRFFMLVRDDEIAAAASGVRPYSTKLRAFVVSAIPAGLAGVLFGYLNHVVTPQTFNLHLALFFLLAVVVGGSGSLYGSIGGVLLLFAVPQYLREYRVFTNILFGVILIAVLALVPGGLAEAARRLRDRWLLRGDRREGAQDAAAELEIPEGRSLPSFVGNEGDRALRISAVTKHFGGLVALEDVHGHVAPGEVVAVIGPNGSGKTTLLNVVSGFYRADSGEVAFGDRKLTHERPASIAGAGIGRTFQTPKILPDGTVLDNVMAGFASRGRSSMLESALRVGRHRSDEAQSRERALALLDYVGLEPRAGDRAGDLPHPHLRFLEIARTLISSPALVLFDEPAAGLSRRETAALDRIVRDLADRGIAVVVVEHNIGLVLDIADRVLVLDSGEKVADDSPVAVQGMPEVARIYLGEDWVGDGQPEADDETPSAEPPTSPSDVGTGARDT